MDIVPVAGNGKRENEHDDYNQPDIFKPLLLIA
jgi:hypothetical protein